MTLTLAVTITTHNRCADLRRTSERLCALQPAPTEVVICADGCTDDTVSYIRANFPGWKLIEHPQSHGSIASRDEMIRSTDCDLVLSLDDDSYPLETDFVARCAAFFANDPELAILSFPQRTDEFPETLTQGDFGPPMYVGSFANSGAVIRRSAFLAIGGYPGFFWHAYEEPDLALRCVAAGWKVRFEPSLTIRHHFTGAQRNEIRTHHRHARNEIWSVLMRCPFVLLLPVVLFRVARQGVYAARRGAEWLGKEPLWWRDCLAGFRHAWSHREPLAIAAYWGWMRLVRTPLGSETEWQALFGRAKNRAHQQSVDAASPSSLPLDRKSPSSLNP